MIEFALNAPPVVIPKDIEQETRTDEPHIPPRKTLSDEEKQEERTLAYEVGVGEEMKEGPSAGAEMVQTKPSNEETEKVKPATAAAASYEKQALPSYSSVYG
jgi:hypothetical protein